MLDQRLAFAPIAIAVQVLGLTNEMTALGALIFLASRVIHAIVFVAGIPWIRTMAWTGGVIGSVMVATPAPAFFRKLRRLWSM